MVALAAADIAAVPLRIGSAGEGCSLCAGLRDENVRLRGQNERLSARVKELGGGRGARDLSGEGSSELTNNRDGRADPRAGHDRIPRITPPRARSVRGALW